MWRRERKLKQMQLWKLSFFLFLSMTKIIIMQLLKNGICILRRRKYGNTKTNLIKVCFKRLKNRNLIWHLSAIFEVLNRILTHRSRETWINLLFQFSPEKLVRFKKHSKKITIFKTCYFFPILPIAKLVRSPVVYDWHVT